MHATTLLPTALLALPAQASTPPQPSLTTTRSPRTTTSAPTTITNTHTLLPRTDGPIVTDGTGHWQPPFDIGGMTTHPLPHPSPPLKTLLTPNCSSPEYCL
ncbi:MAG: hypothetical protein L6R42_009762, partial [Xanthoria sp. 1 TBL-2021]